MKTELTSINPGFKPVSIKVTFETQKELDHFYNICNWTPLVDLGAEHNVDFLGMRAAIGAKQTETKWSDFLTLTRKYF